MLVVARREHGLVQMEAARSVERITIDFPPEALAIPFPALQCMQLDSHTVSTAHRHKYKKVQKVCFVASESSRALHCLTLRRSGLLSPERAALVPGREQMLVVAGREHGLVEMEAARSVERLTIDFPPEALAIPFPALQ
eukprot:gene42930-53263_t